MTAPHLDSDNYADFIKNHEYAVIDYFATWCGPCQMMGPIFDQVAEQMAKDHPELAMAKIDIDVNSQAADDAGVMTVPSLIFYRQGEEIDRNIGALMPEDLIKFINNNLPTE